MMDLMPNYYILLFPDSQVRARIAHHLLAMNIYHLRLETSKGRWRSGDKHQAVLIGPMFAGHSAIC